MERFRGPESRPPRRGTGLRGGSWCFEKNQLSAVLICGEYTVSRISLEGRREKRDGNAGSPVTGIPGQKWRALDNSFQILRDPVKAGGK
jgi:hypothetical protein